MKKFLFLLAATTAIVLSSCTKMDNGVYQSNDALNTDIQVTAIMAEDAMGTKSSNAYTTTTDGLKSFNITIYNGDDVIANNVQFDKPGTGNADALSYWSDGNHYYWSGDATYSFVAYAIDDKFTSLSGITVAKDKVTLDAGTVNSNTSTYSAIPKTGGIYADGSPDTNTNQVDPVVAFATGSKSAKVTTLTFNHTLSRIQVAAKATIDTKYNLKAKFLGYEFRGVSVKASAAEFANDSIKWTADGTANVLDNRFTKDNGVDITNSASFVVLDKASWCNVIPGKTLASTLVAKIAFYDAKTGAYIDTRYFTASAPALVTSVTEYVAGTQYTYNVEIKNAGGSDTDNTDPDKTLDDLEIKIVTVTVKQWTNAVGGTATFGA